MERDTQIGRTGKSAARKRRLFIAISLLVLAALSGAGLAYYDRNFGTPKRFAAVEDGVLYRSAQPTTHQISHLIDTVGLETILIVREGLSDRVPDEVEYARGRGLNAVHIPIKSRQPIPDRQVAEFFRYVDDPANHPILVHCSAGRHRAGYLCALYRIERQGWTVERAMEEMLSFDPDMRVNPRPVLQQLRAYKRTGAKEVDKRS